MRFSLCNEVLRPLPFAAQCEMAAALGYDGLEVAPFTLGDAPHRLPAAKRRALRRQAEDAGLAVTGLHWLLVAPEGLSIVSEDADIRRQTVDVIAALCALCADLGGSYLVHGSPAQRRLPEGQEIEAAKRAVDVLAQAAQAAERAGVVYCLEPLHRGETNFVNTIAEAADIVRRIDNRHFRTMLDCSAAGLSETDNVPDLLRQWLPSGLLAHVQVNDPNRQGPGQGAMQFAPILAALKAGGYAGDVAVEPFIYTPDGPGSAARAIGYLRGIWESLP
ncbi:sugar phosphate isomerase/epimerase family protein [Ferrovibrio sp.]|uniref:sugar phosphate isomerase/epimerase family protein n=1 Tax=Ferrovibrio sp. TaxID=1917215 RepID=UPI0025BFB7E1|nr:sugar phosphate isomerase/epimerase family protein [Ferrovibrio sp.]MBX3455446.1 sugar phosphate isomerase/epimerase [Ferrovibrio sp.]